MVSIRTEMKERMVITKINNLTTEMLDWTEGRKSYNNMILQAGGSQLDIIQADAAEVQKLSLAIVALEVVLRAAPHHY